MEALEIGGPLLDLVYEAPGLSPIKVCRADFGQVWTWASKFSQVNILTYLKKREFFLQKRTLFLEKIFAFYARPRDADFLAYY